MTSTVYNDISKLKKNNITAFFLVIHTQVSFESSALNHLWSSLFPQNPLEVSNERFYLKSLVRQIQCHCAILVTL